VSPDARSWSTAPGRWSREWLRKSRKLTHLLIVPAYRHALLAWRVAATVEHGGQPFAQSYGTVIDVGSNRGQFAIFARHRWPKARLFCFEPLPGPREVLTPLAEELGNAQVLPYALSDEGGERRMHVARSDDSSSLLAATGCQLEAFPDTVEVDEQVVQVRRLDNLITKEDVSHPILMKIDVQGAELDVLRGASGLLDGVREILVECSLVELYVGQPLLDDMILFARECGFRVIGVSPPSRAPDGTPLQCDVLFSRGRADRANERLGGWSTGLSRRPGRS
jgi:FkbM family methyltransferase